MFVDGIRSTPGDVEYLIFPRLLAMAEVLWSPAESRDEGDFHQRSSSPAGSPPPRWDPVL